MWGDHYNLTFDAIASFSYLISPLTASRHLALADPSSNARSAKKRPPSLSESKIAMPY